MHENYQQQQQENDYHQKIRMPPSSTLLGLPYKEPQGKNRQHQSHHLQERHSRQKRTRHYFPPCGLILLFFLSSFKETLTTTFATSYSSSSDVTTVVSTTTLLPYFDFDVLRNITVTVGQTGFLHCRVERLGDKDVSWIRKRDLHILTAGSTTYTSDQRFQVLHPENSGNWTLQIKYPQPRDSGIYECQINTEPKMSLSYTFNVVELKATIIGPTDLYVKSGSDINLTCKIIQGPHELGNIFWYKGSEIIDMTSSQNDIHSGTRITVENDWSAGLTSRLKVRRASSSDTGNFTCVPTIAKSSSVYVHVIIGEHPAAMQHNSSQVHCANISISLCCMLFTILTCCLQNFMWTNTNTKISSHNTAKATITILASKSASTSTTTLSTRTVTSASIAATEATPRNATVKNKTKSPGATRILQSEQNNLSISSITKASTSSSISYKFRNKTNNAAVAGAAPSNTCCKATLFVCTGR